MRARPPFVVLAILATGLVFAGVAFAPPAILHSREAICDWGGGKWASAQRACVTRQCYAQHACGSWAKPSLRCDRLRRGDPLAEVYFQLGDPGRINGANYQWFNKGNFGHSPDVEATIAGERLASLRCD